MKLRDKLLNFSLFTLLFSFIVSCARMNNGPDGGWFDETPPRVIGTNPQDRGTNVEAQKIVISFDEYVKIDNATENVIISPPQKEQPEIKTAGKSIVVELKDTLKQETTYTIDFSDAISDNNEGNPLGNYTFTFSTGTEIDTMEVAGYVLDAENLEPISGIQVGLHELPVDSAFTTKEFIRVSRTDANGHFVIKGVKPGEYKVYALKDMDGNFFFSQKSEQIAFLDDIIVPSMFEDIRQDTTWLDSLHIKGIDRVKYNHYMPDNIMLRAFTEVNNDRFFLKKERPEPDHFTLFFSNGHDSLPKIKGINFNADSAFVVEPSLKRDTITYWLRDTMLVNRDTLDIELRTFCTDTAGILTDYVDTLQVLAKTPYEKRLKNKLKDIEKWQKEMEKRKKKGLSYDSIYPQEPLQVTFNIRQNINPDGAVPMEFKTPLASVDTTKIHLYCKRDTLWYNVDFELEEVNLNPLRNVSLIAEWNLNTEYSLELDSATFIDIYGKATKPEKRGFKIKSEDEYATFMVDIPSMTGKNIVVQLLDQSDKSLREVQTNNGKAEFYYLDTKTYYMRMFVDSNGNGIWDTGCYADTLQAEEVYYYPEEIECRAKWDLTETWNPTQKPLNEQKPSKLVKQKGNSKKRRQESKNLRRARERGIDPPDAKW